MYLAEIQGLRAVAALLVAIYHIWFHRVSGGVDAFFVIAGFFIVKALFKSEPGAAEILTYYKRTLARVMPSAAAVIFLTCAIFYGLQVDSLWSTQIRSAVAALLFVENWHLAAQGVDYLAQGELPSPFQQMWALSVQMQMYFAIPLLLVLLSRISHRFQIAFLRLILIATALAFGYALLATWIDQPKAYFNSFARIWEFLSGVILALVLPRLNLSAGSAKTLGYLCLVIFVGFAAVIPVAGLFPGLPALIPVLTTAGIIVASSNGAGLFLLTNRLMQWLGNLSFTFYLWHWPLLVAWRLMSGSDRVGFLPGMAIILAAGLLAYATYSLIERPYRKSPLALSRPAISMAASVALLLPACLACGLWAWTYVQSRDQARGELRRFLHGGAASTLVPATIIAKSDIPDSYRQGCNQRYGRSEVLECNFGSPDAGITIALVGGSHSLQWLPALQEIARREKNVRIVSMTKGNCPVTFSAEDIQLTDEPTCLEWSHRVVTRLQEIRPAAIVTLLTSTREGRDLAPESIPPGFPLFWKEVAEFPVLAIRDTARGEIDLVNCVDRLGTSAEDCRILREKKDDPAAWIRDLPENIHPLDLTERICDGESCTAVRDGVLVYRDHSHLTATYARLLAPELDQALVEMKVLSPRLSVAR